MTKKAFLDAMEREVNARYSWALDAEKLNRFMDSVRATINGHVWTWNHDGEACAAAWKSIGGKGRPTMKALRALPEA